MGRARLMQYRAATDEEHATILKQIKSTSVLYVCLMVPVIPVTVLAMFLSINMMKRDSYDEAAFVITTLMLVMLVIAVAVFMIGLMSGFIKRIVYINNRNYEVAGGTVTGRIRQPNPKHTHHYVTVATDDGYSVTIYVPGKIYYLAENGKRALVLRYKEPEAKKKKLPLEAAVL